MENARNYLPLLTEALSRVKRLGISNLIIEDKKFSISLHYRLLNNNEARFLKQNVKNIIDKNPDFKKFLHVIKGKKILEIRPQINWNKGSACGYIIKEMLKTGPVPERSIKKLNILRVNIGDDITDETMFSQNYSSAAAETLFSVNLINCVIGKKQSLAGFYLANYSYTPTFIRKITDMFSSRQARVEL